MLKPRENNHQNSKMGGMANVGRAWGHAASGIVDRITMLGSTFLLSDGMVNFSQPWLTNLYCPEKAPCGHHSLRRHPKCFGRVERKPCFRLSAHQGEQWRCRCIQLFCCCATPNTQLSEPSANDHVLPDHWVGRQRSGLPRVNHKVLKGWS